MPLMGSRDLRRLRQFVRRTAMAANNKHGSVALVGKLGGLIPGIHSVAAGTSQDFMLSFFGPSPFPSYDLPLPVTILLKGGGIQVPVNTLTVPLSIDMLVNGVPSGAIVFAPGGTGYQQVPLPPGGFSFPPGTLLRFNGSAPAGAGSADVRVGLLFEGHDMIVGFDLLNAGLVDNFMYCTKNVNPALVEIPVAVATKIAGAMIRCPANTLTGNTVITLFRNGVQVGPVYNLPGGPAGIGTFTWPLPVGTVFNVGDLLRFEADGTASVGGTAQINPSVAVKY